MEKEVNGIIPAVVMEKKKKVQQSEFAYILLTDIVIRYLTYRNKVAKHPLSPSRSKLL